MEGCDVMKQLEGKVAVVTGGASGIGEGIARRFVAEGARVVIGDIQDDAGQEVAGSLGDRAAYVHCDVTSEDDVAALVAAAPDRFGRLDIMVNNAGAIGARGSILDITTADWDATMNLLLRSVFFGMRYAGRVLVDQGEGGSIISMASIAAHSPGNGPHVYGTAKAGIVHLTQRVALELGEQRIRVNAICPGGIVTPLVLDAAGADVDATESIAELLAAMRPYPMSGYPSDVAATAAWLASGDAEFVTGQAITVDGGESVGPKWSDQFMK
jgi:NAD(P)-dependent dehydrogenase (short-subunit alcohol dehydrogenase family)